MFDTILAGFFTFIATNLDDIFILILFYSNKRFKESEIIIGQYAGIIALTFLGLAASMISLIIDKSYIGFLGLVPVFLGIRGIYGLVHHKDHDQDVEVGNPASAFKAILLVAATTIANGGDNIGVYVPFFTTMDWLDKLIVFLIFLLMTGLWCVLARYLSNHPFLNQKIDKYGHIVSPIVLILLGVYILFKGGTIGILV